jgi:hypothetical protein
MSSNNWGTPGTSGAGWTANGAAGAGGAAEPKSVAAGANAENTKKESNGLDQSDTNGNGTSSTLSSTNNTATVDSLAQQVESVTIESGVDAQQPQPEMDQEDEPDIQQSQKKHSNLVQQSTEHEIHVQFSDLDPEVNHALYNGVSNFEDLGLSQELLKGIYGKFDSEMKWKTYFI